MRFILLMLAAIAATSPALAQARYATTSLAMVCLTESALDDGLKLISAGESKLLSTVGCVRAATDLDVVPLSNGYRGQHIVRAVIKAGREGEAVTGYILTAHLYDRKLSKPVGSFGWVEY